MPNFPNNIKNRRKMRHITQNQLAELAGVCVRTIKAYERGYRNLENAEARNVLALANALDCTVAELYAEGDFKEMIMEYEGSIFQKLVKK